MGGFFFIDDFPFLLNVFDSVSVQRKYNTTAHAEAAHCVWTHQLWKRENHVLFYLPSCLVWRRAGDGLLHGGRQAYIYKWAGTKPDTGLTSVPGAPWIHRVLSTPSSPAWSRVLLQFGGVYNLFNPFPSHSFEKSRFKRFYSGVRGLDERVGRPREQEEVQGWQKRMVLLLKSNLPVACPSSSSCVCFLAWDKSNMLRPFSGTDLIQN